MRTRQIVVAAIAMGALVAGLVPGGSPDPAHAQQKKTVKVDTKGAVKDKREYPDEAAVKNTQEGTTIAQRKGPNSCDVVFANNTKWWIHRVYIDGQNVGLMAPGGDYILRDVISGMTSLYAEADFTNGDVRYWGPRKFDCPPNTRYTWTLHP